jgi:hypothetical protein
MLEPSVLSILCGDEDEGVALASALRSALRPNAQGANARASVVGKRRGEGLPAQGSPTPLDSTSPSARGRSRFLGRALPVRAASNTRWPAVLVVCRVSRSVFGRLSILAVLAG